MSSSQLYKSIDVWKKCDDETAIRYRCFELLGRHQFCVQSADYYRLPIDMEKFENLEVQFVELFLDEYPEKRSGLYPSLEEAFAAHEKSFS